MPFPGKYDTGVTQGATYAETFIWKDSSGALIDTSGYSGEMQVRPCPDGDPVASWSSAGSEISFGGVDGSITVTGPAASTANIPPGNYVYDLRLVSPGGIATVLVAGLFVVTAAVTR